MHDSSRRRVANIAKHLQSSDATTSSEAHETYDSSRTLSTEPTSAEQPSSSYARVHGRVSEDAAAWTRIPVVQKNSLQEVIYEKAEGIAKVIFLDINQARLNYGKLCLPLMVKGRTMCQDLNWLARSPSTAHTRGMHSPH